MSRQLGMNITTAQSRLVADLLYSFVESLGIVCHRCEEVMSRQTVSIEHKRRGWASRMPLSYTSIFGISRSNISPATRERRENQRRRLS